MTFAAFNTSNVSNVCIYHVEEVSPNDMSASTVGRFTFDISVNYPQLMDRLQSFCELSGDRLDIFLLECVLRSCTKLQVV